MARILFLAHRIPYPPNKGDKIRSWNFLKHLIKNHEVHAGFFVDDKNDLQHIDFLNKQCASVTHAFALPLWQKIASLRGFFSGRSLTELAYPSRKIRREISDLLATGAIDLIYIYSAAPYTWLPDNIGNIPIITDFVDVDSEKWKAYSRTASLPMRLLYAREAKRLLQFEENVANHSRRCLLVSQDEADLLKYTLEARGTSTDHIIGVANGVDCNVFNPSKYTIKTASNGHIRIIFTGAMDYQPNVEAVTWFASEVLPKLENKPIQFEFIIAGAPVAPAVQGLSDHKNISVRGRVLDMASEIAEAHIVVAPMKTARGIQNKVLEGMAMAKPVIVTAAANEGINAHIGTTILQVETADDYAAAIMRLAENENERLKLGIAARAFVEKHFSWEASWALLDEIILDSLSPHESEDET